MHTSFSKKEKNEIKEWGVGAETAPKQQHRSSGQGERQNKTFRSSD